MAEDRASASYPEQVDRFFTANQDRLRRRIRWMMGKEADRVGESGDFLGGLYVRLRSELREQHVSDEQHMLRLATRIARNLIVDQVRRPRVQRFDSLGSAVSSGAFADQQGPTPMTVADAADASVRVLEALETMEVDYQTVIELRDFEGLSFQDIAARMGRTENAVQILHRRAVLALGAQLRPRPRASDASA